VLAVAYERWSLTRGSKYSDLTGKLLVHVCWKTGHRGEVVAYDKRVQPEIQLYIGGSSDSLLCLLCFLFVDNISPNLQCSMRDMIYPETFNSMTPLHALAVACTENLPPSGLGNSLTVTNLPSSYTPRILLKLFQGRYPSAYRATIPPASMEGRKVFVISIAFSCNST